VTDGGAGVTDGGAGVTDGGAGVTGGGAGVTGGFLHPTCPPVPVCHSRQFLAGIQKKEEKDGSRKEATGYGTC